MYFLTFNLVKVVLVHFLMVNLLLELIVLIVKRFFKNLLTLEHLNKFYIYQNLI